jgi:hypothetical protein
MVVQFLGRHGEVLRSIPAPPLCRSISISDGADYPGQEHFPPRADFPEWDPKRKVADLSEMGTPIK